MCGRVGGRQNPVWVNVCAILGLQLNTCYSYNNFESAQTNTQTHTLDWLATSSPTQ